MSFTGLVGLSFFVFQTKFSVIGDDYNADCRCYWSANPTHFPRILGGYAIAHALRHSDPKTGIPCTIPDIVVSLLACLFSYWYYCESKFYTCQHNTMLMVPLCKCRYTHKQTCLTYDKSLSMTLIDKHRNVWFKQLYVCFGNIFLNK